jgi:hypothetical protein
LYSQAARSFYRLQTDREKSADSASQEGQTYLLIGHFGCVFDLANVLLWAQGAGNREHEAEAKVMDLNIFGTPDDLNSIFEGIGILPAQYGAMCRRKLPSQGERKLLFAVLEDAIRCYLKHRDSDAALQQDPDFVEASEWLGSDEEVGPFSFVRVCDALGINADRLRAGINHHTGRLEEIRC